MIMYYYRPTIDPNDASRSVYLKTKMNLYCFLLPFAFVNVLAVTKDYKNLASITNKHIELASKLETKNEDPDSGLRRLEYIIKRIILKDKYNIEELTYMLTVPEYAVRTQDLEKCMEYQYNLQTEIYEAISLDVPSADTVDFGMSMGHLIHVGFDIRKMIYPCLLSLITRIIDGIEQDFNFTQICYLVALYKNSEDSPFKKFTFITTAIFDYSFSLCVLTSIEGKTTCYKQNEKNIIEILPGSDETRSLLLDLNN
ncbi:uncharacterized protein LOC126841910 isoform X2 [Adelges cooleyi]|uniref:uncharacterized protein LOC126841910 isoform X2 n=2 Tax=Adelges cooleyi TaxID=133065 RepID=UPI00217FA238|nr:uncharacterized protein LOC126841910 isoform X2 [Adelges cooleyi]